MYIYNIVTYTHTYEYITYTHAYIHAYTKPKFAEHDPELREHAGGHRADQRGHHEGANENADRVEITQGGIVIRRFRRQQQRRHEQLQQQQQRHRA